MNDGASLNIAYLSKGLTTGLLRSFRNTWREAFALPILVVGVFGTIIIYGSIALPDGFDRSDGLLQSLWTLVFIYVLTFLFRVRHPGARLAALFEGVSLFLLLALCAALASSVLAIGSVEFIDDHLHAMDQALFPFFDWADTVRFLAERPRLHSVLTDVYTSLNWQPVLLLACFVAFTGLPDANGFLASWAAGLAFCILPFHWLPAVSAYNFYGVGRAEMPKESVELAWSFMPVLEGMRDGTITSLSSVNLTGLVTIPSFHACGATVLMWWWWRIPILRWPMLFLNTLMLVATVPIGSHYVIDVVVGILVALLAIWSSQMALARLGSE